MQQATERENQPKRIDFTKQSFMANGNEYFIDDTMSIARYAEYQSISPELGYGLSVPEMFTKVLEIEQNMNNSQFVKASVILNDFANGLKSINDRTPVALKLCALFINRADEDITIVDKRVMDAKFEDWKKEGLAMLDFFTLAVNTIVGLVELYNKLTQSISEITGASEKAV